MHVSAILTLKVLDAPSTATATGPTLATALSRSDSLPLLMETMPDILAPTFFSLYKQLYCFMSGGEVVCNEGVLIATKKATHFAIERIRSSLINSFVSNHILVSIVHVASLAAMVTIGY